MAADVKAVASSRARSARDFSPGLPAIRASTMKNVAGMSYFSSASITAGVVRGFGAVVERERDHPLGLVAVDPLGIADHGIVGEPVGRSARRATGEPASESEGALGRRSGAGGGALTSPSGGREQQRRSTPMTTPAIAIARGLHVLYVVTRRVFSVLSVRPARRRSPAS